MKVTKTSAWGFYGFILFFFPRLCHLFFSLFFLLFHLFYPSFSLRCGKKSLARVKLDGDRIQTSDPRASPSPRPNPASRGQQEESEKLEPLKKVRKICLAERLCSRHEYAETEVTQTIQQASIPSTHVAKMAKDESKKEKKSKRKSEVAAMDVDGDVPVSASAPASPEKKSKKEKKSKDTTGDDDDAAGDDEPEVGLSPLARE